MRLADRFGRRGVLLLAGLSVQAAAAITVLLLLMGGGDGGLPAVTPIAEAAERTAQYPGARMTIAGRIDVAGSDTAITMQGGGEFNGTTGRSRLTLAAELPPGAAAQLPGGRFEIEQVGEEGPGKMVIYQRSDVFAGALPGGAEWMKIDFSEDIDSQRPLDLRQWLGVLRSSHDLENLGTETIRGIPTTRYHATIDQRAEVDRLREEGQERAADALETAIAANNSSDITEVEVWVGRRTVHRFRMTLPFALTAPAGTTMQITVDLFDFGVEPDIDLPDEDDVFDATELAREGLEQLAD